MKIEKPQPDAAIEEWSAYSDRCQERAERAERLLWEICNGKHSLPGTLVQIDRLFDALRDEDANRQ